MKWMSGSTERQCDRVSCPPPRLAQVDPPTLSAGVRGHDELTAFKYHPPGPGPGLGPGLGPGPGPGLGLGPGLGQGRSYRWST
jgi:hypothetical protein